MQPNTITAHDIVMLTDSHEVYVNGGKVSLSKTEFEMLKVLMEHKDETVSKLALTNYVWGDRPVCDETVKCHMHRLRKKIGFDRIATVWGHGFTINDRRVITLRESMEA